jgi:hypothetical protein
MSRDAVLPRVTTWLVLVAYVLVVSGLPLPFGVAGVDAAAEKRLAAKDRSRPFPCMDKPCGCATAEQCFTRCCCNTPAETLAWARAHRVDVAVLRALERRVAQTVAAPSGGCCAAKALPSPKPSCCQQPPMPNESAADLCSEYQSLAAAPPAVERIRKSGNPQAEGQAPGLTTEPDSPGESPDPSGSRVVVLRAMLACGGIVAQWFTTAGSLPPPRLTLAMSSVMVGRFMIADDEGSGVPAVPEIPPPRFCRG